MRITRANVETAQGNLESVTEAVDAFTEAAEEWIDFQDQRDGGDKPDSEEVADARERLEEAISTLEGFGLKLP